MAQQASMVGLPVRLNFYRKKQGIALGGGPGCSSHFDAGPQDKSAETSSSRKSPDPHQGSSTNNNLELLHGGAGPVLGLTVPALESLLGACQIARVVSIRPSRSRGSCLPPQTEVVHAKGALISFDYQKTFDRMSSGASTKFLQQIGVPSGLVSNLAQVWATMRVVQFALACHHELLTSACTPQGCPLSPITLSCWMASAQTFVNMHMRQKGYAMEQVQKATTRINMDNRSYVDQSLRRLLDRTEIPGCSGAAEPICEKMNKKFKRKPRPGRALVGPLVAYGWISRKPHASIQDKLHSALSAATGTNRMANKLIRKVVYAANTHMDSLLVQRRFRRVCRLRQKQGCDGTTLLLEVLISCECV
eukprot:s10_g42.t1